MAVLKAIQQQLEAFNKMYKEDKENSDRRLQDLTICFDEFFSKRSNVRLDAGSNDSHTHHRSDPKKRRGTPTRGKGAGTSQSLRGDPFRDFNMSILAAYIRPSSNSEIFKVNFLAPHPAIMTKHTLMLSDLTQLTEWAVDVVRLCHSDGCKHNRFCI